MSASINKLHMSLFQMALLHSWPWPRESQYSVGPVRGHQDQDSMPFHLLGYSRWKTCIFIELSQTWVHLMSQVKLNVFTKYGIIIIQVRQEIELILLDVSKRENVLRTVNEIFPDCFLIHFEWISACLLVDSISL